MDAEADAVGRVYEGAFYQCRDGSVVGPMIDDGCEPSFGYAAALGGIRDEAWLSDGWSRAGIRARDLITELKIKPDGMNLAWTGCEWRILNS